MQVVGYGEYMDSIKALRFMNAIAMLDFFNAVRVAYTFRMQVCSGWWCVFLARRADQGAATAPART